METVITKNTRDKAVYELEIDELLENVMPPLSEIELELLTKSLVTEGCRDPLVVWNGVVVDGNNRYRICQEQRIPFSYIEMEFNDKAEAKRWIIRNQLARRNVPDYVKCELVLPIEAELKAEAKKRMLAGTRNDINPVENFPQGTGKTRDAVAEYAGVSGRTMDKVKVIVNEADEETKEKLRNGDLSIHKAYTTLKEKEGPIAPPPVKKPGDIVPGHGTEQIVKGMKDKGEAVRQPDSVYAIPPIVTYGNNFTEDLGLDQAAAYLKRDTETYIERVSAIRQHLNGESRNEDGMRVLREVVTEGYAQIKGILSLIETE